MRMQVSEQGDEVLIELSGVAGRHHHILQALTQGQVLPPAAAGARPGVGDLSVRAGADDMRIRFRKPAEGPFAALAVYHRLRRTLLGRGLAAGAGTREVAEAVDESVAA